jgi:hypothetical protein
LVKKSRQFGGIAKVIFFNTTYPNRGLTAVEYKEAQASKEKINQQSRLVKELEGREKQLSELINANVSELETLELKLTRKIETLPSN